jgi:NTP pyrophosphatase (non-canonical NTP hydrolase)
MSVHLNTEAIGRVVEALDANDDRVGIDPSEALTLRVLKVVEEAGEAAAARIGGMGQNPRKGITHTADELRDDLFDVALAALVAAATVDSDWAFRFARHVDVKTARLVKAVEL